MSESQEALQLVNDERIRRYVSALRWCDDLSRHANEWAQHLANEVGHMEHSTGDQRPDVSAECPPRPVREATNTDSAIHEI